MIGGCLFVAGEVLRQVGGATTSWFYLAYLSLSILGLVVFLAGLVVILIEFARTTRRPFVEHVDRIIEALDREHELIAALEHFETSTLEFACERLKLQSTKVVSRLGMIGGGEGLRTSLVGIALLGVALISKYEPAVHGWTMNSLAFFGLALLLEYRWMARTVRSVTSRLLQQDHQASPSAEGTYSKADARGLLGPYRSEPADRVLTI
ncbi:hypothetical protein [Peristeroidobacter agariperforans]|uniref:hypothetical protein n=1 Tax=Peristeroidobacter agariperforans TaxID=268404 RepID=UPI00101CAE27|nr:hypothetical protein [Peristeroidobacter agariperforans]